MTTLDSLGHTAGWESLSYNAAGQTTLIIDGDSNTTSLRYDGEELTATVLVRGGVTVSSESLKYDSAGELTLRIDGASRSVRYAYSGGEEVGQTWY
jgi:YD repeat-containing protein